MWAKNIFPKISKEANRVIINYIRKLFNHNIKYEYWPVPEASSRIALDLIEAITREFSTMLSEGKKPIAEIKEIMSTNLGEVASAIKEFCPDRQISELRFVYNLLRGEMQNDVISLDSFFEKFIAAQKEELFDQVFTPGGSFQSVHVLNYWKHKMQVELGFDFTFTSNSGTMEQDPYRGEIGNAFDAFFKAFTPNRIIKALTQEINLKKEMLCSAAEFICKSEVLSKEMETWLLQMILRI